MSTSIIDQYPDYKIDIGIEVHVQLSTKSKIFCSCSNAVSQNPNSNICNVCSGHPGVLPVLNKKVVDNAILTGLATNCTINPLSSFARKHYFYPDLPKNYQITQDSSPICLDGSVPIILKDGSTKNIRLIRIHIEEDAGKNIHSADSDESFVDLNRTGTPLLEIVSHPDISGAYEAKAYLKALRLIVQYLNVCSGNMEEGAFRADTNISVRKKDSKTLGTRTELKNINSFKFIGDAIEYEVERQLNLITEGKKVKQETRLWDTKNKKTVAMRSKEEAADYRYFPDPDLPLIQVDEEVIARAKTLLPELPHDKRTRFMQENGLTSSEADIVVEDAQLAAYYEKTIQHSASKQTINWILRDVLGYLKEHHLSLLEFKVTPAKLATIISLLEDSTINNHAAKKIFEIVAKTGGDPKTIMKEESLEQIGSSDELEAIIVEIIKNNPDSVAKYKSGKDRLFGFFVGQAMKQTAGKGNPKVIQELLKKYLS